MLHVPFLHMPGLSFHRPHIARIAIVNATIRIHIVIIITTVQWRRTTRHHGVRQQCLVMPMGDGTGLGLVHGVDMICVLFEFQYEQND